MVKKFIEFYSVFFGEMIPLLVWDFLNCRVCYTESLKKDFKLCPQCSEEIEELKK